MLNIFSPGAWAGAGLGLFLGLLAGLATSPVVGTLVGALGTAVAAVLGVRAPKTPGTGAPDGAVGKVAAAAFGFAGAIGVVAGLWVRTHDALSPTMAERVKAAHRAWLEIGYSEPEARKLAALEELGSAPVSGTAAETEPGGAVRKAKSSVLMADDVERLKAGCAALTQPFLTEKAALEAVAVAPPPWPRLGVALTTRFAEDHSRWQAIEAVKEVVCSP